MADELAALAQAHWQRGWDHGYAAALRGEPSSPLFNGPEPWVEGYDQAWAEGYREGYGAGVEEGGGH